MSLDTGYTSQVRGPALFLEGRGRGLIQAVIALHCWY